MSKTGILAVKADGDVEFLRWAEHAAGGAPTIWTRLAERYLDTSYPEMVTGWKGAGMQPMWDLATDTRLAWWERICLIVLTFDRIWVAMEHHRRVLNAIQRWLNEYGHGQKNGEGYRSLNLEQVYEAIVDAWIAAERDKANYIGFCIYPHSVGEFLWQVQTRDIDEHGDILEDTRAFNVFSDEGARELFTAWPELLLPVSAGYVRGIWHD